MNIKHESQTPWGAVMILLLAAVFILFAPVDSAFAAGNTDAVTNILCNAVNQLTGGVGRAIAIVIIISLAIMLFIGKVSWGMAIAVAFGMGLLFGAKDVVSMLSGNTACTG